jgi:DNA-binding NarL/FixJ family response regulator
MQPLNVVIAHGDCVVAESLASLMHGHFRCIAVAPTTQDVRKVILRQQADAVVVDLGMMSLQEVRELCLEFPYVSVITTHRIPDDKMWSSSLAAGAVDCCDDHDVQNIIRTVARTGQFNRNYRVARAA